MPAQNPPNIIFIMADQLAAHALGLYGNGVCKTPNLDRLAKQGTVFENAYSNNPLCVPSRASLLTGKLSPKIGVYDNANELSSSTPTMAHFLRKAGYWTELCGKMHFIGPDQLHGFNTRSVTDVYPANYQWIADWSAGPAFVPSGTALNGVVEAGSCIRTMQEDYDDEVEHACIQGLYDYAREPARNPFFQLVSFTSPHTPFTVSQDYWDRYSAEEIDSPIVGEIPFEELDYHSKALFFAHGRHRHRISANHLRDTRHAYYGMISYIDDKVGKILDTLEKTGVRDNTAVVFTSDHGEMLGERGMWFKQCFWEWSAHVPLIVSMPGMPTGTRCSSVVSLVDLLPTFLDMAGLPAQETETMELDGTSILPLVQNPLSLGEDTAISDYLAIGPCVPCRMIVKGKYKYILTDDHPSLLYNLEADPNELVNLNDDTSCQEVIAELHAIACRDWNTEELTKKVLKSQNERNFIASIPGETPKWDHIARIGDDTRFVRKDGVDATKGRLRLPSVPAVPPDWPQLGFETVEALMQGKRSLSEYID
jgi:choline-sulfatase